MWMIDGLMGLKLFDSTTIAKLRSQLQLVSTRIASSYLRTSTVIAKRRTIYYLPSACYTLYLLSRIRGRSVGRRSGHQERSWGGEDGLLLGGEHLHRAIHWRGNWTGIYNNERREEKRKAEKWKEKKNKQEDRLIDRYEGQNRIFGRGIYLISICTWTWGVVW